LGISATRNAKNYTPSNKSVNDFFVTNPTKFFTYFGSILLTFWVFQADFAGILL
jgi:hypothetical protein